MVGGPDDASSDKPDTEADALVIQHLLRCWDEEAKNADELAFRENLVLSAIAVLLGLGLYQVQWYREHDPSITPAAWMWVVKVLLLVGLVWFILAFTGLFGKGIAGYGRRWAGGGRRAYYRAAQGYLRLWQNTFSPSQRLDSQRRLTVAAVLARLSTTAVQRYEAPQDPLAEPSRPPVRRSSHLLVPEGLFDLPSVGLAQAQEAIRAAVLAAYIDLRQRNAARANRLNVYQQFFLLGVVFNALAIIVYILLV